VLGTEFGAEGSLQLAEGLGLGVWASYTPELGRFFLDEGETLSGRALGLASYGAMLALGFAGGHELSFAYQGSHETREHGGRTDHVLMVLLGLGLVP
jgi:hypothetical protein